MSEYQRLVQLTDSIRQQLDALTAEVARLQGDSGGRAAGGAQGGPGGGAAQYDLARVIPPTQTDVPDSIVGGVPTREFPDCCAVGDDTDYYCTGTLIAPTLVITARHCPNVRRVFLKGHDVTEPRSGETINVVQQFEHDDIDLRILVLERPSSVAPRHVAQGPEVRGATALLVGFGTIDFNGTMGYGQKRKVEVPIASLACGGNGESSRFGCRARKEMVAGHRGLDRDSCRGDSGGPLYIQGDEGFYLLGVTSRGLGGPRVCGDGGIYVRADQYLDWVQTVTGIAIEGPRT